MSNVDRLELLSEDIKNEIDELQSFLENGEKFFLKAKTTAAIKELSNIISNLESLNDGVYNVFEELKEKMGYTKDLRYRYEVLWMVCDEKLTYEEKLDLKLKFKIDEF